MRTTRRNRDNAVLRRAALEAMLQLEDLGAIEPPGHYPPLCPRMAHNRPGRFRALVHSDGRVELLPLDRE
jgi:hypothetical protein